MTFIATDLSGLPRGATPDVSSSPFHRNHQMDSLLDITAAAEQLEDLADSREQDGNEVNTELDPIEAEGSVSLTVTEEGEDEYVESRSSATNEETKRVFPPQEKRQAILRPSLTTIAPPVAVAPSTVERELPPLPLTTSELAPITVEMATVATSVVEGIPINSGHQNDGKRQRSIDANRGVSSSSKRPKLEESSHVGKDKVSCLFAHCNFFFSVIALFIY